MCHTADKICLQRLLTKQPRDLLDRDHAAHTDVSIVTVSCSSCNAIKPFHRLSSLVAKLNSCFCTVQHPSHKSRSRVRECSLPPSCLYTAFPASSLRPADCVLIPMGINALTDTEKGKFQDTNQRQSNQIFQELAQFPPKVLALSFEGLKSNRKQSTALLILWVHDQLGKCLCSSNIIDFFSLQLKITRHLMTVPLSFKNKQKIRVK